jgi:hypothetical protein
MGIVAEWIAGNCAELGGFFGAVVATVFAKSKGYITFGKPVERRHCPDIVKHMCSDHKSVIQSIRDHEVGSARREEKIDALTERVGEMGEALHKIAGYLQGKNGYHD